MARNLAFEAIGEIPTMILSKTPSRITGRFANGDIGAIALDVKWRSRSGFLDPRLVPESFKGQTRKVECYSNPFPPQYPTEFPTCSLQPESDKWKTTCGFLPPEEALRVYRRARTTDTEVIKKQTRSILGVILPWHFERILAKERYPEKPRYPGLGPRHRFGGVEEKKNIIRWYLLLLFRPRRLSF
jgi:hypothetical protein